MFVKVCVRVDSILDGAVFAPPLPLVIRPHGGVVGRGEYHVQEPRARLVLLAKGVLSRMRKAELEAMSVRVFPNLVCEQNHLTCLPASVEDRYGSGSVGSYTSGSGRLRRPDRVGRGPCFNQ